MPLILASCGGGGGGGGFFFPFPPPVPPVAEFTVGGSVSGLRGSGLVLQLSGSADVPVAADGAFVFGEKRGKGTGYAVSVKQQPSNPTQTCSVSDGAGTIGDANVDNVRVVCAGDAYKVSVTVTGLASNDLVLQNNGGDDLAVGADGVVSFATPVADGADYGVTVKTQPTALQVCVAKQGFGTVAGAVVGSVTVDCSEAGAERFAFTANEGTSDLTKFKVEADGRLTGGTSVPIADPLLPRTPQHVAVHPSGQYVYTGNIRSPRSITQYAIAPGASGALTRLPDVPEAAAGTFPVFVGFEPKGRFAYVVGDGQIRRFNVGADGGLVAGTVTPGGSGTRKMTVDPAGRFIFVPNGATIDVFRVDQTTGDPISPPSSVTLPPGGGFIDVAVEPSGRFAYVATGNNPGILLAYAIDPTTGALNPIGSVPLANTPFGMAIDPTGRFVYVANRNSNNVSAYATNPRTGALTPVPGQPFAVGGSVPNSVAVDRTGRFAYTANQAGGSTISFFTIDRATGALSLNSAQPVGGGPQFLSFAK